ncbi:hypothetical protein V1477_011826, partial [Vespula maculifrons]
MEGGVEEKKGKNDAHEREQEQEQEKQPVKSNVRKEIDIWTVGMAGTDSWPTKKPGGATDSLGMHTPKTNSSSPFSFSLARPNETSILLRFIESSLKTMKRTDKDGPKRSSRMRTTRRQADSLKKNLEEVYVSPVERRVDLGNRKMVYRCIVSSDNSLAGMDGTILPVANVLCFNCSPSALVLIVHGKFSKQDEEEEEGEEEEEEVEEEEEEGKDAEDPF